jgi:hypothetical protein
MLGTIPIKASAMAKSLVYTAAVADARTGEGEEEAFQEDRRPNGDDRQA